MKRSFAPWAAIRQSHASARSMPPPTAWPLSSASVGTGSTAMRRQASVPRAVTSAPPRPSIEARSAPAEKIRWPAPVMAISRTSSSPASSSHDRGEPLERVERERVLVPAQGDDRKAVAAGDVDLRGAAVGGGGGGSRRGLDRRGLRNGLTEIDIERLGQCGLGHLPISLDARLTGAVVQLVEQHLRPASLLR